MVSFMKGAGKKRRDAAEKPIVKALKACGAECWYLSGRGLPDLLVRYRGCYYCGEVKSKGGKLTEQQTSNFPLWRTVDDAFQTIGAVVS